ncbi:MAG TPA: PIN domain-containing protein [Pseudonocardia sp.]|uniref:PIN domain-containing protein n=1 Tax=Pseudonocardia sp. TaxID=60912 RepID=UPI002CEF6079|nr:PIN domain-containing protein [Pseudonocardia sp.]HTF46476.1 PIN domain-containing protein [Pseudonocardia sp.]
MAILIDTSVLIAVERGQLSMQAVLNRTEQVAISVVTAAELLHGVHRADPARATTRTAYVEAILDGVPALPIDMRVARTYAQLSASLAVAGSRIKMNDLWIAATAIAHNFLLMATDPGFDRVPGLRRAPITEIPHPR